MDAYFAIPDPQMLKDFRDRRAEGGDDACLRPVLRNYIKMKLHPKLQPQINLNESKEDLIAKLNNLPDETPPIGEGGIPVSDHPMVKYAEVFTKNFDLIAERTYAHQL